MSKSMYHNKLRFCRLCLDLSLAKTGRSMSLTQAVKEWDAIQADGIEVADVSDIAKSAYSYMVENIGPVILIKEKLARIDNLMADIRELLDDMRITDGNQ